MFFDALRRTPFRDGTTGDFVRGYVYHPSNTPNNFPENVAYSVYWTLVSPVVGMARGVCGDNTPIPFRELSHGWPTEEIGEYINMHTLTKAYTITAATIGSLLPYTLFRVMMPFILTAPISNPFSMLRPDYKDIYQQTVNSIHQFKEDRKKLRKTFWERKQARSSIR